ncbi:MAG: PTS sugar transporter subunit IIA [Polyangiaceae bacterium]|nr:PTS sugar transporter subunit IIA [Polyangiaceae bacterium]
MTMSDVSGGRPDLSMRLSDIVSVDRILVDADGSRIRDKADALHWLSSLLAPAIGATEESILRLLLDRERLQSTGIGDGVAIPHTAVDAAPGQAGALLLCPVGVPFEAIDGVNVSIVFGVVGPKRATGEHLRTLARISRLLRDPATRSRLVGSASAEAAYALIHAQDTLAP